MSKIYNIDFIISIDEYLYIILIFFELNEVSNIKNIF